jgi:hypothetical protein
MKVGDLVTMEKDLKGKIVFSGIGVIVDITTRTNPKCPRVGVFWSDASGIDYEPVNWLEVVSESR